MRQLFPLLILSIVIAVVLGCRCYKPSESTVLPVIKSPLPHTYLSPDKLPMNFDWRNVNGTNFCTRTMTQMSPSVCGSCWAEGATGALSDRYAIATQGRLRVQLAPQQLLNFNEIISGGSCNGGDPFKAYDFMNKYGITDDTCAPFQGLNWVHGFEVAAMKDVEDVQNHQCFYCQWGGSCTFLHKKAINLYGVEEFGHVKGEQEMMAEIYARGPIACHLNSEAMAFDMYKGGIITCPIDEFHPQCNVTHTDHIIVIAGWGVDKSTKLKYWIGRNSYGTQWGEGSGGGWFRLERGVNALGIEGHTCSWAVPKAEDVERANRQYYESL